MLVCVVVLAGLAGAEPPERIELLDGRVSIARLEGSFVDADTVRLDWGDTRLTIVARELGTVRLADVRERIAHEVAADGAVVARVEPLALARPDLGFAASVRAPRVVNGRELVYSAFVIDRDRRGYALDFFVGANDSPAAWRELAARVAATITVRAAITPAVPRPPPAPPGTCTTIASLEIAPYPITTVEVFPAVAGKLAGKRADWSVWRDDGGFHAEAIAGGKHVVCSGRTREAVDKARLTAAR